jgi:hypothetical protein
MLVANIGGLIDTYPNLHPSKVRITIQGEIPKITGNAAGLTQCFSNLLGNAVKFVAPGKMPEITIRAERQDRFVRLWFEDNGIGIPKEAQSRVFEEVFIRVGLPYKVIGAVRFYERREIREPAQVSGLVGAVFRRFSSDRHARVEFGNRGSFDFRPGGARDHKT